MTLQTTLGAIRAKGPCASGWVTLLEAEAEDAGSGKFNPDKVVTIERIVETNNIDDAIWAVRACTTHTKETWELLLELGRQHVAARNLNSAGADILDQIERAVQRDTLRTERHMIREMHSAYAQNWALHFRGSSDSPKYRAKRFLDYIAMALVSSPQEQLWDAVYYNSDEDELKASFLNYLDKCKATP